MDGKLEVGKKVRDFILEKKIGAGGVGEVWRARHQLLDKVYAIKVIFRHLSSDNNFQDRFLMEAVAMASLDHPNIVGIHNFFIEDERTYLIMSFIEGESLEDMIQQKGPIPVHDAIEISSGILDALNFAHSKGVIHRDVKPSNIIIRPDKQGCLVDFGIALVLGKPRVTQFGTNIGTPEYMSPEQIKAKDMDHRTDVYSYGCVLYEMLTGEPPFGVQSENLTDFDIMSRHINTPPPSLRASNPDITAPVEAAIMRALAKNPDDRFSGCREMALVLRPTEEMKIIPPPDPASRIKKLEQTRKLLIIVVLFLLLSAVAATTGWVLHKSGAETGTAELMDKIDQQTAELAQVQAENKKLAEDLNRYYRDLEAARTREKTQVHGLQREQFVNAVLLYALIKSNFRRIKYSRFHIRNKMQEIQQNSNPSQKEKLKAKIRLEKERLATLEKNSEADFQLYVNTVAGLAKLTSQEIEKTSRVLSERFKKNEQDAHRWIPKLKDHIRQARPAIAAGQALSNERLSSWRKEIRS